MTEPQPTSGRARIAREIREEMVCCDIYEKRGQNQVTAEEINEGPHNTCYWGELAARILEGTLKIQ